jgi:hypothetical protein
MHTSHDGQIIHIPANGKTELRLVPDRQNLDKVIIQIYGERGGLHGTIRVWRTELEAALKELP